MKPELRVEETGFERGLRRGVSVAKDLWFVVAAISGTCLAGFMLYSRTVQTEQVNAVQDVEIARLKDDNSALKQSLNDMRQEFREFRSEARESFNWIKNDLSQRK